MKYYSIIYIVFRISSNNMSEKQVQLKITTGRLYDEGDIGNQPTFSLNQDLAVEDESDEALSMLTPKN